MFLLEKELWTFCFKTDFKLFKQYVDLRKVNDLELLYIYVLECCVKLLHLLFPCISFNDLVNLKQ